MKKDIEFLKVENIGLAVVPDGGMSEVPLYSAYIINMKEVMLENVFVRSKGSGVVDEEPIKTSTIRMLIEKIAPKTFVKIDDFDQKAASINNEYWISFKENGYLFDKKYIFVPGSIDESNFIEIPLIEKRGVLIK